jgi:hypothetical protein
MFQPACAAQACLRRPKIEPDDQGGAIVDRMAGVPTQAEIPLNGHALQCRITTEDPNGRKARHTDEPLQQ